MFGSNEKTREENRRKLLEDYKKEYNIEGLNQFDEKLAEDAAQRISLNAAATVGIQGKIEETTKISLLTALAEQNWIIINQLNRLNENIEKLVNK